jgi:hypothetical protein
MLIAAGHIHIPKGFPGKLFHFPLFRNLLWANLNLQDSSPPFQVISAIDSARGGPTPPILTIFA